MGSIEAKTVLVLMGIFSMQSFFSTRKDGYWGILLPLLFTGWGTQLRGTGRIESRFLYGLLLFIGLSFLLAQWREGREVVRRRRKKEWDNGRIPDEKSNELASWSAFEKKEKAEKNWNKIRE